MLTTYLLTLWSPCGHGLLPKRLEARNREKTEVLPKKPLEELDQNNLFQMADIVLDRA